MLSVMFYILKMERLSIQETLLFDHAIRSLYQTDLGKLAYVGKQGVFCLLAESLYAERPGYTSPNHRVQDFIRTILTKKRK